MKKLNIPIIDNNILKDFKAGEVVLVSGIIHTARDAAHKLLVELIEKDLPLPIELNCIYYTGPTPAKPNEVIGSCGPTSSYRMDKYSLPLIKKGLKVMIGKGSRSEEYKKYLKEYNCLYLSSIGGSGLTIKDCVKKCKLVSYKELGAEAIYELEVKDLFCVVTYDTYGNDLFLEGVKKYAKE